MAREELKDVYSRVTDKILADLEKGVLTWRKPWSGGTRVTRPLRFNGNPYQGVNILMLWAAACEKGYRNPIWMTFKQALEIGAHVAKEKKARLWFMPTSSQKQSRTGLARKSCGAYLS